MRGTKQVYRTCEHCGVQLKREAWVDVGAVSWGICLTCEPLVRDALAGAPRPRHPFGAPVETLPDPVTSVAWWWGYRLACEDLGYTSLSAADRPERDALSAHTNRWLNAILGLRYALGQVKDNPHQGFIITHFRQHLREQFGPVPPGAMARRAWLLSKLTPRPLRAPPTPTHIAVPPRGSLRRAASHEPEGIR